ncbi:MAG: hypothetical protein WD208_08800 [Dehalococcoidia bacterium]
MTTPSSARKKSKATDATAESEESCTHHWVIEPPNGAVSHGRCRVCGENKEFRNSFEYSSWYGTKSPNGPGAGKK